MNRTGLIVFAGFILISAIVFTWMGGVGKRTSIEERSALTNSGKASQPVRMPDAPEAGTPFTNPTPPSHPELQEIPTVTVKAENVQIPANLRTIVGLGEKKDYMTRIKGVHQLGKNLTDQEIKALYVFLNRHNNEDNLHPDEFNAIKNDVSVIIMLQQKKPAHYGINLMAMYYDRSHDNVWRDYCIQHLGGWYSKADFPERLSIGTALWKATEERDLSIAGTALIALFKNAGDQFIPRKNVASKALEMCEDARYGELAKITALQICAKLNETRALPAARKIAASEAIAPLRMSAIAAIGTLGDLSDKSMLEKYASSPDVRLRKSAQGALKKLK